MHIKPITDTRFKELQNEKTSFILHTTQNKGVPILAKLEILK